MAPPRRVAVRNARVFDSRAGRVRKAPATIVVEGERIASVERGDARVDDVAETIDAGGRVALPGLIDCHVHVTSATHDIGAQGLWAPSLIAAEASAILRGMLERGFTTVRDAGGADLGLQTAVERGLFEGPRLFISGFPVSQTGGHCDMRPRSVRQRDWYCACSGLGLLGAIADGVGEVRRAVREQIRTGANQVKVMAGGGVGSPADPLEGTQFSMDELRAAVEEAEAAGTYVLAHAYSPRAVQRAVDAGVRSIEHGNLIDAKTVRAMKRAGTFYVPTLSTYAACEALGAEAPGTFPPGMLDKLKVVKDRGLDALRLARDEGVPICFGTDLLGVMHPRQNGEFALRRAVQTPAEILQGATIVPARLMGLEGKAGEIAAGVWADMVLVDGDPSADLAPLIEPERGLRLVMQRGRVVRSSLKATADVA